MKRLLGWLMIPVLAGGILSIAGPARPALASFVSGCSVDQYTDYNVRRLDAQAYAEVAIDEGYEWGGGCWNTNNKESDIAVYRRETPANGDMTIAQITHNPKNQTRPSRRLD